MVQKDILIKLEDGVHARPAALFVEKANSFKSSIKIVKDNIEVDAKSIMSIMMLGLTFGTKITLKVDGEDESEAIEALYKFIDNNFHE
jgi:phosphotransferase system HPr (HPr) family protein